MYFCILFCLLATTCLSQFNGTCGSWCDNVPESSSCAGCNGTSHCHIIPQTECDPGSWPNANSLINGNWFPSRSTHYGGTSGGACGYEETPNCDGGCDVPDVIQKSPFAGLYAAPQGDYYAQLGDYLSCGQCWEIQCMDPHCTTNTPIVVQLADACPCAPNVKWCCNKWSHCNELGPDTKGQPHCPTEKNGIWASNSIHLDLSDAAFGMLTTGNKGQLSNAGVVNTMIRRVSCPVKGNAYIMLNSGVDYAKSCYTVYPNKPQPCFYYISAVGYNLAGYGSVTNISVHAGVIENKEFVYKVVPLIRSQNYPKNKPQEQYGSWTNKENQAIFLPMQFILTDTAGRTIKSQVFTNFTTLPKFIELGVQFDPVS